MKISGFVEVANETVIARSQKILNLIYQERSIHRKEFVAKWLQIHSFRWMIFWKFIGFKRPTRREALFDYYHKGFISPYCDILFPGINQVETCKRLINAALINDKDFMFLSDQAVELCGIRQ